MIDTVRHTFYAPNAQLSDWIRDQFAPGFRGYCIDVGASDGQSTNSTFTLEHIWRWTVLSVEANPYFKDKLEQTRVLWKLAAVSDKAAEKALFHIHLDNIEAFSSLKPQEPSKYEGQVGDKWATTAVPVTTLNDLIAEFRFPRLDALCVDTEGTERDVLSGLDFEKWHPKVVMVEAWDRGSHDDFLATYGYERVFRMAENDGYIRRPYGILG